MDESLGSPCSGCRYRHAFLPKKEVMEITQVHVLSQALHIFYFIFGHPLEYFCLPLNLPF